MIFLLVFCILVVIREFWALLGKFLDSDFSKIPTYRLVSLGLSISYIMTIILTGFDLN